ncbi:MAG: Flp pilus assembly complex ATPase component TadA [Nitrospirae bacterium]|nr:Flp pilus assembly complex ATPase component TadA [Nitrospirota bacterium]
MQETALIEINDIIRVLLSGVDAENIINSARKTGVLVIDEAVKREKLTYEEFARHISEKYGFTYSPIIDGSPVSADKVLIVTDRGRYSWFPFYVENNSDVTVIPRDAFQNQKKRQIAGQDDSSGTIQRLYNEIIESAIQLNATDIHIDHEDKTSAIHFRIDGEKRRFKELSAHEGTLLTKYIVMLCNETSNVKFDETKLPQDGRLNYRGVDLRVAFLPTHYGYKTSIRLLKRNTTVDTFETLGFLPEARKILETYLRKTYGLIIIAGPTGSGKSRTLSVCLKSTDRERKNVLTIEDPVEYKVYGVNQSQVHLWEENDTLTGYDFQTGARAFLRHDPDVCLIGEIRDKETADTAVELANTGHLVFSTLHANTTATVPLRLTTGRIAVDRFSLASSLILIVGQRLVKKLCTDCRNQKELLKEDIEKYYFSKTTPFDALIGQTIYTANPQGCNNCIRGYTGRTVIEELMIVDDLIRDIIISDNANPEKLKNLVTVPFVNSIEKKARHGHIDILQVFEVIS